MSNNLFHFANGELTQDGVICWLLNWFNCDNPRLKKMAKDLILEMIGEMLGDKPVESVAVFQQFMKIDVLVIVNKTIGIIIEDKVYSTVHDNQIERYKKSIENELKVHNRITLEGTDYALVPDDLTTVYWKTGFYYDYDKVVSADCKVVSADCIIVSDDYKTGSKRLLNLLEFLAPYGDESEILADYIARLQEIRDWYSEHADVTNLEHLRKEYYTQHTLMRQFFPKEKWVKKAEEEYEPYQIYYRSSYGRPNSQMGVFSKTTTDDVYELFWRIDSDNGGPYLSLRLYQKDISGEKGERHKARHQEYKDQMKALMDALIAAGDMPYPLQWEDVKPRNRENAREAVVFHLHLKEYLAHWDTCKEKLTQTVRNINDRFLELLK